MNNEPEVINDASAFDKAVDAAIDAAVDQAAQREERELAQAIWKLMTKRKGRRNPHRTNALQALPEVAARIGQKRSWKQHLARKARRVTARNCR